MRFQELETLGAYHLNLLMEEVTIILELKSKLFLLKSTMIKSNQLRGMNITISTSAETDDEAYELLKMFGLPLRENQKRNIEAV